jgi:hypothetical protein
MINNKDLKGKFIIVCEKCGSRDVSISVATYDEGISEQIVIYCNKEYCGNEHDDGY